MKMIIVRRTTVQMWSRPDARSWICTLHTVVLYNTLCIVYDIRILSSTILFDDSQIDNSNYWKIKGTASCTAQTKWTVSINSKQGLQYCKIILRWQFVISLSQNRILLGSLELLHFDCLKFWIFCYYMPYWVHSNGLTSKLYLKIEKALNSI